MMPVVAVLIGGGLAASARAQIVVGAGSSVDLGGGSLDSGCHDLVVAGTLALGSGQAVGVRSLATLPAGVLAGGTGAISWSGDWSAGGLFDAGTSTASWVDGCGAAAGAISGAQQFHALHLLSPQGRTLRFTSGETQIVAAELVISGAPGQLLKVRSTTPGSEAYLDLLAAATQSVAFVDVADNHAIGEPIGFPGPAENYGSVKGSNSDGWFSFLDEIPPVSLVEIPAMSGAGLLLLMALLSLAALRRFSTGRPRAAAAVPFQTRRSR